MITHRGAFCIKYVQAIPHENLFWLSNGDLDYGFVNYRALLVTVGVWWLVSTSQSNRAEFVDARVDDSIQLSGVLVDARVDVPTWLDKVSRLRLMAQSDRPERPIRMDNCWRWVESGVCRCSSLTCRCWVQLSSSLALCGTCSCLNPTNRCCSVVFFPICCLSSLGFICFLI